MVAEFLDKRDSSYDCGESLRKFQMAFKCHFLFR